MICRPLVVGPKQLTKTSFKHDKRSFKISFAWLESLWAILVAEKPRARYLGCGKPSARDFGCGKKRACYIGRGKSLGGLFLIHRKPSEEQFCEARIPQWLVLGPGNGKSPVRFPAPPRSVWGNLLIIVGYWFHQFGNALGCVWEWLVMGWSH